MTANTSIDIHVKPRVLIADDSRIVRATLIKHIEGMFEFREALDGEQAWETLLVDPSIRVVITDLTMPKLDGYGLLQRIRASKVARIRDIPVVVVSGSDVQEERDRAKAAGATDLITKGIATPQLLSRLDILARLVSTQGEFERSLEALARNRANSTEAMDDLDSPELFRNQAGLLLANAIRNKRNFVILGIRIGLKHAGLEGLAACPPSSVVDAVGRLLRHTVRKSDRVARTGEAEFAVATGSINFDSARFFAQRVCQAIANANLSEHEQMSFVASCGVVSLSDFGNESDAVSLETLCEVARQRATLGLDHAITGVVGQEEEVALQSRPVDTSLLWLSARDGEVIQQKMTGSGDGCNADRPAAETLLQWLQEGRQDQVLPHLERLAADLQPLMELVLQQRK
ncbi:response regulator [Noviherbaspirillum cavernae]|uniref:Response regulator n=1 Tax=Noviherbaspirillum cavernae TaxID=2320862 RepID=A0A418X027_9BURK|nr:response regulator [Noviherbaspirillum cavernae]RJG05675.1 response regulator [Noviherbaspirillum cavernae]